MTSLWFKTYWSCWALWISWNLCFQHFSSPIWFSCKLLTHSKCIIFPSLLHYFLFVSVLFGLCLQNSSMRPSPPTHPSSQQSPHPQPPPPHSQMMPGQVSIQLCFFVSCEFLSVRQRGRLFWSQMKRDSHLDELETDFFLYTFIIVVYVSCALCHCSFIILYVLYVTKCFSFVIILMGLQL